MQHPVVNGAKKSQVGRQGPALDEPQTGLVGPHSTVPGPSRDRPPDNLYLGLLRSVYYRMLHGPTPYKFIGLEALDLFLNPINS
jgi:hypothetical protein